MIAPEHYLDCYQVDKMKKSWCSTLLILFFSLSSASASERLLILSYDVYVGGIKVVKIDFETGIGSKQYSVDISLREVKFFSILFSWQMSISSEGKIIGGVPIPRKASVTSRWKGKTRLTKLEYNEFGVVKSTKLSPEETAVIRSPVTDQMKRGARDLSTGLLYLLQKLDLTQKCAMQEPIFDGKYAFLIKLIGGENVKLGAHRLSAYKGDALKCNLFIEKLGGYRVDPKYAAERFKEPMKIWFGKPFSKFLHLPIQLELETNLGWLVAHLTKAEFTNFGKKQQIGLVN